MKSPIVFYLFLVFIQMSIGQNIGINTTNPMHPLQVNVDSMAQESSNQSNTLHNGFYLVTSTQKAAQSFIPNQSGLLSKITIRINLESPGSSVTNVKLHSNGPSGAVLASISLEISQQNTTHKNFDYVFTSPISLTEGLVYAISLEKSSGQNIEWRKINTNPYQNGVAATFNGTSWSPQPANDMVFDIFITDPESTNINAMNVTNNGKVGIGLDNPKEKLEVNGAIKIGQNSATKPEEGTIRWNPNTKDFEGYNGTKWVSFTNNIGWGTKNGHEDQKLNAIGLGNGDNFGNSVDVSGNYVVVGAYWDDDNGGNAGAAYVFYNDNNIWSQQAKLIASDGAPVDFFGKSVAIDGDYIVVGAVNNLTTGAAYIFTRSGTNWSLQQKLVAPDGTGGEDFGGSVRISGEYVVIGAPLDKDNGNNSGSAYIFKRTGTIWDPVIKLTAPSGDASDFFGISVDINGDVAAVGAYFDDDIAVNAGAVYVYQRVGTDWILQTKLLPTTGDAGSFFGESVSVFGNEIVVGAPNDNGAAESSGAIYVFENIANIWTFSQKLHASDAREDASFGKSVSIYDNTIVVGAMRDDSYGNLAGKVYVFKKESGTWQQEAKLIPSDIMPENHFGFSVSIYANSILVGAPLPLALTGNTYFFKYN